MLTFAVYTSGWHSLCLYKHNIQRKTKYMKNIRILYGVMILFSFLAGCTGTSEKDESGKRSNSQREAVQVDKSITPATAFNNLFLDSLRLQNFLNKHTEYAPYQQQYFDFYKQRNYEYAWFDTTGISEQANNFMNLLNTTIIETNDSSLYNKKLAASYSNFVKDST